LYRYDDREGNVVGHLPQRGGICPKKGENGPVLGSVVSEEVVPVCDGQGLEFTVDPEFRQDPLGVWFLAVVGLMWSLVAISLALSPFAINLRTSRGREEGAVGATLEPPRSIPAGEDLMAGSPEDLGGLKSEQPFGRLVPKDEPLGLIGGKDCFWFPPMSPCH
jgi:hypothetical protein